LKGMCRQCGMISFNINLEVRVKAVSLKEADYRTCVEVILMLGGFLGFGFNQQLTLEANFLCIVNCHT